MDEEELDQWYESEKERLTEEYQLKLKKAEEKQAEKNRIKLLVEADREKQAKENKKLGKETKPIEKKEEPKIDFHADLKKEFLVKMKKLHKNYELKSKNQVSRNLKRHFQNHKLKMLKKKLMKPFERFKKEKKKEEA